MHQPPHVCEPVWRTVPEGLWLLLPVGEKLPEEVWVRLGLQDGEGLPLRDHERECVWLGEGVEVVE